MPTIACPGCGKQYKLPANAAGQVAKCACGIRFKLSAPAEAAAVTPAKPHPSAAKQSPAKVSSAKSAAAKPVAAAAAKSVAKAPAAKPSPRIDNDFWDEALREEVAAPPAEIQRPSTTTAGFKSPSSNAASGTSFDAPAKKKAKKSVGVRWGFDWGKVVAGLAAFLVFGGLAVGLVMVTGRMSRGIAYLAIPAIGGLFTAINGLMGEEGIW